MVSTRGGAKTGAEDSMETLRKKPTRKATAKAATTTTKAAPAKKTTRSKKAEPEPEPDDTEDELAEPTREESPAPVAKTTRKTQRTAAKEEPPKTTRRGATRVQKDEELAKPASKNTKSTATKATKAKPSKEEETPALPPPSTKSRATRATRATAAKEKAAPLSPKKITQVSKAPAKSTRSAPLKGAAAKPVQAKTAGRPALRRRNVSDENADVPQLKPEEAEAEEAEEDEIQVPPHRTTRARSNTASRKEPEPEPAPSEHESPASTRPTTPSEAPEQSFNDEQEESLGAQDEEQDSESEETGDSHDELCGPKTPMKRCSPRQGGKHTSVQKSAMSLHLDVPMKTPVRRFAVLGTKQGTPQTEKPVSKPTIPMSDFGSMTVARARDRAMVFPRLQAMAEPDEDASMDQESEKPEDESTPVPEDMDMHTSMVLDDTDEPESVADSQAERDITEDTMEDLQEATTTTGSPMSHADFTDKFFATEDHSIQGAIQNTRTQDESISAIEEDPAQHVRDLQDPDNTIVVADEEEERSFGAQTDASTTSQDSVIITHHEGTPEYDVTGNDSMEDVQMSAPTPKPETLVWENLREDVTIPFNFDSDLTMSRSLPEVEHGNRLSLVPAADGPEVPIKLDDIDLGNERLNARQSIASVRQSLDATVNLSDFIDVKSLSEPSKDESAETARGDESSTEQQDSNVSMQSDANSFEEDVAESEVETTVTAAREVSELDIALDDLQDEIDIDTPRYARPTIASRRKSLPAVPYRTPQKENVRPYTADGASMPRIANPFVGFMARAMNATPAPARPSTSHSMASSIKPAKTPRSRSSMAKTPGTSVPQTSYFLKKRASASERTPVSRTLFARTPGTSVTENSSAGPGERFPGMPSRQTYDFEAVSRAATPATVKAASQERFPGLPPRDTYEPLDTTPVAESSVDTFTSSLDVTPLTVKSVTKERFPGLPARETYEELNATAGAEASEDEGPATPQVAQEERFPGLPARRTYEEHAKTAMPTTRFRTPPRAAIKRPTTVQKPASLRKVALKASTPASSRTPMKTPLKGAATTPGQEPMTPHPAAPLRGVNALVEVYTSDGSCATPAFTVLLQRLGAKTTKTFSERVTHVVFKEGSPQTLQRLRIHNKQVAATGIGNEIHCVNSRWVTDCDTEGKRVDETDEAYAVDMDEVPQSAKRRRKSMEPMSLMNIGGNVVRDTNRKSSLGRSSLGRASMKFDSPSEMSDSTPKPVDIADKENSGDDGSPATPQYLAAPSSLVQQTAPMNRVKKLDFGAAQAKNRRLTFFNGGA